VDYYRDYMANVYEQQERFRRRGHDLVELRYHWDEWYVITWRANLYRATRRDNGNVLAADTAPRLYELLREDYSEQPVPRECADRDPTC
jgi:hypothetical protein